MDMEQTGRGLLICGKCGERTLFDEGVSIETSAAPGAPTCTSCSLPLEVRLDEAQRTVAACSRCRERAVYELPDGARRRFPALRGVLAPEHRIDVPPARERGATGGSPVALTCPGCQAPLRPTALGEMLHCEYCHTVSRLPASAWQRLGGEPEPKQPWWLLFAGVSAPRAEAMRRQQAQQAESPTASAASRAPTEEDLDAPFGDELPRSQRNRSKGSGAGLKRSAIFGLGLAIVFSAVALFKYASVESAQEIEALGSSAEAVVQDKHCTTTRDRHDSQHTTTRCEALLRFATEDGREIARTSPVPPGVAEGASMVVYYDPDDPYTFVRSHDSDLTSVVAASLAALGLAIWGVIALVRYVRLRRREAS